MDYLVARIEWAGDPVEIGCGHPWGVTSQCYVQTCHQGNVFRIEADCGDNCREKKKTNKLRLCFITGVKLMFWRNYTTNSSHDTEFVSQYHMVLVISCWVESDLVLAMTARISGLDAYDHMVTILTSKVFPDTTTGTVWDFSFPFQVPQMTIFPSLKTNILLKTNVLSKISTGNHQIAA